MQVEFVSRNQTHKSEQTAEIVDHNDPRPPHLCDSLSPDLAKEILGRDGAHDLPAECETAEEAPNADFGPLRELLAGLHQDFPPVLFEPAGERNQ